MSAELKADGEACADRPSEGDDDDEARSAVAEASSSVSLQQRL